MKDDAFHLTPLDIRRYDFGSALRGYDRARVDTFRDQVAAEVERLSRHAHSLEEKAQGFHEQLRAFRDRDKALNDALVSAQQLRSEVREQAEREAQLIIREAKAAAERLLDQIQSDVRAAEGELESLHKQRRTYLAQLRVMVDRHLAEIEAAESMPMPSASERRQGTVPLEETHSTTATPEWLESLVKEK
jgi:DivIVA domain-containing protein